MSETLALAAALIERPSVTPGDAGCQQLVGDRLGAAGFRIERLDFGAVSNLWACHGHGAPVLAWLGHTDVVPPGPEAAWHSPPFTPSVRDGRLFGRGATDMKGAVAAAVTACERFTATRPAHRGTLAMLLTSDEEGDAVDGTERVLDTLYGRGECLDWCLVGEPSSQHRAGDTLRVGRRGSLGAKLRVNGIQGHVAYPDAAVNPVHGCVRAFAELTARRWDQGGDGFPPTTLQISNVSAGTGAENVIPGTLDMRFNLRYGPASQAADLCARIESTLADHGLDYHIDWRHAARPFTSQPGPLREAVVASVRERCGVVPEPSTAGGTSDGRFVAPRGVEVVELGSCHASAHQVDEHVTLDDLATLTDLYRAVFERLLD